MTAVGLRRTTDAAVRLEDDLVAALRDADVVIVDPGVARTAWGRAVCEESGGRLRLAAPAAEHRGILELAAEIRGAREIVAVGGGAALDQAKLARLADGADLGRRLQTGRWGLVVLPDGLPQGKLTAVPTTLGTGAEASAVAPAAVGERRRLVMSPWLRPERVVRDASALLGLSDELIAGGLLEVGLRLVGPYVVSEAVPATDEAVVAGLAELDRHAAAARHRDPEALLAVARLSARCHGAEFAVGRHTFAWPLWYLANELSTAAALTKMEASRLLLPACLDRLRAGAPGWGNSARLAELERAWSAASPVPPGAAGGRLLERLATVAGVADLREEPLARHGCVLRSHMPGGLAVMAFRAWGGPGNALSGVPLVDLEHVFGLALGRPSGALAAQGGRLATHEPAVAPAAASTVGLAQCPAPPATAPTVDDYLGLLAPEKGLALGYRASAVDVGGPHLMAVIADVGMRVAGPESEAVVDDMAGAMGLSVREAAPRAVGEAVERYALAHGDGVADAVDDGARMLAEDPDWGAFAAGDPTDRVRSGVLVPAGVALPAGGAPEGLPAAVPASWVDFPARPVHTPDGGVWEGTPSGAAAHLGWASAVDAALEELVERDAAARAWWAPYGVEELDLSGLDRRERRHRGLIRLLASDIPTAVHRFPTAVPGVWGFYGWVLGPEGGTACGVGVSADDITGAERALREAWQIRHLLLHHRPGEKDPEMGFHGLSDRRMSFWASRASREAHAAWAGHVAGTVCPSEPVPASRTAELIRAAATDWDVLLVDLSQRLPEAVREFGFHAVKAMAAQLQPLVLDEGAPWALLSELDAGRRTDTVPLPGLGPGRRDDRGWQPLL